MVLILLSMQMLEKHFTHCTHSTHGMAYIKTYKMRITQFKTSKISPDMGPQYSLLHSLAQLPAIFLTLVNDQEFCKSNQDIMASQVESATCRMFGLGNFLSITLEFCNKCTKKAFHTLFFCLLETSTQIILTSSTCTNIPAFKLKSC